MLISLNWLRDYVEIDVAPERLSEDLTMAGLNVEGLEHRLNPFAQLRIGKVLTCAKHPNADRLSVCTVDIGEEKPRDIVCGAPNVRMGLEVAVIPAGSSLPDGTLVKKGKLRGARSDGMICSASELGLGDDQDGILELDLGEAPGTPLAKHFGEEDWILDIEVTPNRPDQLGYLGVAREVAAIYGQELRLPESGLPAESLSEMNPVPVDVQDPAGCPRYIARRLVGGRVGASPPWLCRRLEAIGLRPINNVVDITNFVLYETGQPLHAFDAEKLAGGRIIVRRAEKGERALTLEEKELTLGENDLVIADAEAIVAIAGVMGCDNSKVDENTHELVLESAYFDPGGIRKTRQRLDLATDSSYRFERGADFDMVAFASERAARLLAELTGAKAAAEPNDVYPIPSKQQSIELRLSKVNGILGTAMSTEDMADILQRLDIPASQSGEDLLVDVPAFRRDLEQEIDLIEEIARLYGYNRVPAENRVSNTLHSRLSEDEKSHARLHDLMTCLGYQEILTSSFMDERNLDLMGLTEGDARRRLVGIRNPLVSFNSRLRSTLLPGMLDVLKTNFHRGQEELRLYQLSKVFLAREGKQLPEEPMQFTVLLTGTCNPKHWTLPKVPVELADVKGLAQAIASEAGLTACFEYSECDPYYVPSACFRFRHDEMTVAQGGLLRPSLLQGLKQKRDVFCLEFMRLPNMARPEKSYRPLPSYPALRRDLALLVPDSVRWQNVAAEMERLGGKWLEDLELFDIYRGQGIPANTASCAVRLVFRSREGTLTDKQVDKQLKRILGGLKDSLQVTLRS